MYTPVIGLEIHVQIKSNTKMFSREAAEYFNKEPNSTISPVSFGLPGALPVPNEKAFEKAIRLAIALNCSINQDTKFDRKHYYYPDLSKGYQISQFDKPVGYDGFVEIEVGDDSKRIRIQRIHIEEDTAKSIHDDGDETLIDYNKAGVPLAEIVTKPDFQDVEEVLAFAKRLRQIVRYTDTSDAEMQKGQMRYELNISVKKPDEEGLPNYKVEVKNIGSISVLEKVIEFEIARQIEAHKKGEKIPNQTRGIKGMTGETLFQRSKESADDYRYLPEPDIPPIHISDEEIKSLTETMPELPVERKNRYLALGLDSNQSDIFVEDTDRGEYFDAVLEMLDAGDKEVEPSEIAKWVHTEIAGAVVKENKPFPNVSVTPKDLLYLITMTQENKITRSVAKKVIDTLFNRGGTAESVIRENDMLQVTDSSEIEKIVDQVIAANEKVVKDIEKNPNAVKFLVGQVMRESRGKANPHVTEELLRGKLGLS